MLNRREENSLRSVLDRTLRTAARVRDRLSADCWRILVNMEGKFDQPSRGNCDLTAILNLANDLILDLAAFSGTMTESMTRTQAFRFLDIGRRLERAMLLISLVENCFVGTGAIVSELLEAVLELDDSLMTYRSRYMASLQLSAVLDLLLTDETNPRSVAYQLRMLAEHVEGLPRQRNLANRERDERLSMAMLHHIRMVDIEAVSQFRSLGDDGPLESLLLRISKDLPLLSNAISHRYLVHTGPSQQMADITPDSVA